MRWNIHGTAYIKCVVKYPLNRYGQWVLKYSLNRIWPMGAEISSQPHISNVWWNILTTNLIVWNIGETCIVIFTEHINLIFLYNENHCTLLVVHHDESVINIKVKSLIQMNCWISCFIRKRVWLCAMTTSYPNILFSKAFRQSHTGSVIQKKTIFDVSLSIKCESYFDIFIIFVSFHICRIARRENSIFVCLIATCACMGIKKWQRNIIPLILWEIFLLGWKPTMKICFPYNDSNRDKFQHYSYNVW